ncbi:MAG: hypothetical protein ACOX40_06305 [Bacilli bacterium]|jgi:hypothetical protein|nr:hypothetical protein [Acholeplasmataceae bacterium]
MDRKLKRLAIILLLFVLILSGCGPTYKTMPNRELVVTVAEDYIGHLIYEGELPKLVIPFSKNVNVANFSQNNYYVLTKNDDFEISKDIALFFKEYDDRSIITKRVETPTEEGEARLGGKKFPIDSPSYDYRRIITTEDGTRFSMEYRQFTSGGVTYYGWTYHSGITITMEMPLMVVRDNNVLRLKLLPLPFDTRYEVSGSLKLDKVLSGSKYLDESYYTFQYPDSMKALTLEQKENRVKNWYIEHTNGRMEDDKFVITYLGNDFIIEFGVTKRDKDSGAESDAFKIMQK